jgi:SAM-dependent methyltransferase
LVDYNYIIDLKNIIIYFYLGLRLLFSGKWKESFAHIKGGVIRVYEGIRDLCGKNAVQCNYCGWKGYAFRTFVATHKIRRNAVCPKCQSLERHRRFLDEFNAIRKLFNRKIKVLDIAPNYSFSNFGKNHPDIDYVSVDLQSQIAMHHMDIQDLKFQDEEFDIVICYHVLDYVPNDIKGISEIKRVLKSEGVSISQDGINFKLPKTNEFGKALAAELYRIRQYGQDYFERWEKGGFSIQVYNPTANILYSFKTQNNLIKPIQEWVRS